MAVTIQTRAGITSGALRWSDVDTLGANGWSAPTRLTPSPRQLHPSDAAVVAHHSAYFRRFRPGSFDRSLELGPGRSLYPLLLAAAASTLIHAVDPSAANVAYLVDQVVRGADAGWQPFYDRCRALNPDLPPTMTQALARVWVEPGGIGHVHAGRYDLASMNFVAENISADRDEVASFCRAFIRSVRPGGHLVASFRERQSRDPVGNGSRRPMCAVDRDDVMAFFAPYVDDLVVDRVDAHPTLPGHGGCTGTLLLTARRVT